MEAFAEPFETSVAFAGLGVVAEPFEASVAFAEPFEPSVALIVPAPFVAEQEEIEVGFAGSDEHEMFHRLAALDAPEEKSLASESTVQLAKLALKALAVSKSFEEKQESVVSWEA